jgi:phosphonate transport system substrate-binding protein
VAESLSEMAALMRAGKVDLYIDSAFPSMIMRELAGSKFLLRRWKRGVGEYRSVIFAKKGSGRMSELADLRGKTVAFEKPFSSSGYFFPKLALMEAGLKPMPKKEPSDAVAASEVGYVFSNADENTMAWVLRGRVSAGATDHQSYAVHARANIKDLAILHESAPIPRHILSYRRGLDDKLVVKIKETLLAMDKSETGGKALFEFQQTARFDSIPAEFNDLIFKSAPFLRQERGLR